jgi:hypothetical protein
MAKSWRCRVRLHRWQRMRGPDGQWYRECRDCGTPTDRSLQGRSPADRDRLIERYRSRYWLWFRVALAVPVRDCYGTDPARTELDLDTLSAELTVLNQTSVEHLWAGPP